MSERQKQLTTRDLAEGRAPEEEPLARDRSDDDGAARTSERAEQSEFGPLLPEDQTDQLMSRWQDVQSSFVDKPRESVERADALVADLMQRLAASFSEERERLEAQWEGGSDVSTEDLRVALTRYRSFFDRLLSV